MPVVARVPVGNRTLKAPLRKGKEMAVRVMMVERKISKAMKDHAPEHRQAPAAAPPEAEQCSNSQQGNRIEEIKEGLPGTIMVAGRPDPSLGPPHQVLLPEIEQKYWSIRKNRSNGDGKDQVGSGAPAQKKQIEDSVGRGVHLVAGY